jgi:L-2-hydroxyglutarate oxidase LhgO
MIFAFVCAIFFRVQTGCQMLPFKGIYLYCDPQRVRLRTHIYPVPNLSTPFLGVHTTLGIDGSTKIGPTAIPGAARY